MDRLDLDVIRGKVWWTYGRPVYHEADVISLALEIERLRALSAEGEQPVAIGRGLTAKEAEAYRAIRQRLFKVVEEGPLACSHPSGDSCIEWNLPPEEVCDACAVEGGANAIHNLEGVIEYRRDAGPATPHECERRTIRGSNLTTSPEGGQ